MTGISAIIVAAGSSRRMGFDKLSAELAGCPVLARSIITFARCPQVEELIVVTSQERFDSMQGHLENRDEVKVVPGGQERHLSVWNGLKASNPQHPLIAVHDGARPLVTGEAISRCAEVALKRGAASLAHRVVDTLKRSQPGGTSAAESVSRDDLWAMETPQIFQRQLLFSAYESTIESGEIVTDEVSAVQAAGHEVHFVENLEPNLKITLPSDLEVAEALLQRL